MGHEARIPLSEIERLLGVESQNALALYGRVSGPGQKEDLQRQLAALQQWAEQNHPGQEIIVVSDIGSGLKADRKGLARLLALAQEHRISEVVISYPDRLTALWGGIPESLLRCFWRDSHRA